MDNILVHREKSDLSFMSDAENTLNQGGVISIFPEGKLYKDGNYYYYEDDILGMPDFRRWLRSYGSSITVLEPQTLIDEIIESTRKTLSYYNKLNSIKT